MSWDRKYNLFKKRKGRIGYLMNSDDVVAFIEYLKTLKGGLQYDGDASCQVIFQLKNGKNLRIGITDDDLCDKDSIGLWVDQYEGLKIK